MVSTNLPHTSPALLTTVMKKKYKRNLWHYTTMMTHPAITLIRYWEAKLNMRKQQALSAAISNWIMLFLKQINFHKDLSISDNVSYLNLRTERKCKEEFLQESLC